MRVDLDGRLHRRFFCDHTYVFKTRINGSFVPGAVLVQVGMLGIGGTWRPGPRRSYSVVLSIGVTDDAPDLSLSLRVPVNFGIRK